MGNTLKYGNHLPCPKVSQMSTPRQAATTAGGTGGRQKCRPISSGIPMRKK
jgi:hypothetical protein